MDVDARIQLFDLKTKYQFQTSPGFDQYNMPLYNVYTELGNQTISYYPLYQGFLSPVYINGIQVPLQTDKNSFFNVWPNVPQQMTTVAIGNGGSDYTFTFPIGPNNSTPTTTPYEYILRGHVDINGVIALTQAVAPTAPVNDPPIVDNLTALTTIPATPVANVFAAVFITTNLADGTNIVVTDSGQFLEGNQNFGLLMTPGKAPNGNTVLPPVVPLTDNYTTTSNVINYFTGQVFVNFPVNIPAGMNINAQCFFFQTGLPRGCLFWNNTIILRSPPAQQYLVELDAYLSPAGFLATNQAITFAYMSEYIARGAARKIMADTGDLEQFNFYEPLFKEQESLVWKRSQRQFTASRTQTIYSQGINQGQSGFNNLGGSTL